MVGKYYMHAQTKTVKGKPVKLNGIRGEDETRIFEIKGPVP